MAEYVVQRLVAMFPVLLLVSILVFLMIHLTPGDPVQTMLGGTGASAEEIQQLRNQLGLNDPLPVQYVRFVGAMLTGQERSIRTQRPVVQAFFALFPSTVELAVCSLALASVIGISLGVVA